MIPALLLAVTATLPVDPPKGFTPWQQVGQEAFATQGPGVMLEARRMAVRVHADVDPEIAAGEMGGLVGSVPRGSLLPSGALRFDWGDDRSGATAVLLPDATTAWLAVCRWDVPARVPAARRSAARGACLEALLRGRVTPSPAEALPFTPPSDFRRGLGSTPDALYYAEGPGDVTITAKEIPRPLSLGDDEELSRLTDEMVGGGVQLSRLERVAVGDVTAVRYAGRAEMYSVTMNLVGWLLPRGQKTMSLMGFAIGPLPQAFDQAFEQMARGTQGLTAAPERPKPKAAAPSAARPVRADEHEGPEPMRTWLPWVLVGGTVVLAVGLGLLFARTSRKARERHRREALERARRSSGAA